MATKKDTQSSQSLLIALVACAAGAWFSTDYVNSHLEDLHVHPLPPIVDHAKPIEEGKFYPVLVAATAAANAKDPAQSVDALFEAKEKKKEAADIAVQSIDYVAVIRQQLRLQGVTSLGAIINDKYYQVGDVMPVFGFVEGTHHVIPRLTEIKGNIVTIDIDHKRVPFQLPKV